MQTYSNLITAIQTFATAHQQINSCVFGEIFTPPDYPLLHGNLVSTEVGDNQDIYTIDFFIGTQVTDFANVHEALSDTKLMANDTIAYMNYAFGVNIPVTITPAQGTGTDNAYGHTFQLVFKLNQGLDLCVVPLDGLVPSYTGNDSYAPSGTYSQLVTLIEEGDEATLTAANDYTDSQFSLRPRVVSITSSSTPTPNCDTTDQYNITALDVDCEIQDPSGTPLDGQTLRIRISAAAAIILTFTDIFRFKNDDVIPELDIDETAYFDFVYNSVDETWDCLRISSYYGGASTLDLIDYNGVGTALVYDGKMGAAFDRSLQKGLYCQSASVLQGGSKILGFCLWVKIGPSVGELFNTNTWISKDDNATQKRSEYLLAYNYYPTISFQVEEPGHITDNDGVTHVVESAQAAPVEGDVLCVFAWYNTDASISVVYYKPGQKFDPAITSETGLINSLTALPLSSTNTTNTAFSIGGIIGPNGVDFTGGGGFTNDIIRSVGILNSLPDYDFIEQFFNYVATGNNNNDGTLIGSVAYSADSPTEINNTYSLTFSGGYVSIPNMDLPPAACSVVIWFKTNSFGTILLSHATNANTYIKLQSSTIIRVQTDTVGTFKDYTFAAMVTGVWNCLIVIRHQNYTRVYVNGTQAAEVGGQEQINTLTINQIGRYWDGSAGGAFSGKLAGFQKFDYAISNTDIDRLSTGGPFYKIPQAKYMLNEGAGTTAIDDGQTYKNSPPDYEDLPTGAQNKLVSCWNLDEASGTRYNSK